MHTIKGRGCDKSIENCVIFRPCRKRTACIVGLCTVVNEREHERQAPELTAEVGYAVPLRHESCYTYISLVHVNPLQRNTLGIYRAREASRALLLSICHLFFSHCVTSHLFAQILAILGRERARAHCRRKQLETRSGVSALLNSRLFIVGVPRRGLQTFFGSTLAAILSGSSSRLYSSSPHLLSAPPTIARSL